MAADAGRRAGVENVLHVRRKADRRRADVYHAPPGRGARGRRDRRPSRDCERRNHRRIECCRRGGTGARGIARRPGDAVLECRMVEGIEERREERGRLIGRHRHIGYAEIRGRDPHSLRNLIHRDRAGGEHAWDRLGLDGTQSLVRLLTERHVFVFGAFEDQVERFTFDKLRGQRFHHALLW